MLVHRAGRSARLADRRQHVLDFASGDPCGWPIAERSHDMPERDSAPALVRCPRLGEHRAMTGER